ncbi:MAG: hypothetical protein AB7E52_09080, partial [Bdellovibrionales bacterium]
RLDHRPIILKMTTQNDNPQTIILKISEAKGASLDELHLLEKRNWTTEDISETIKNGTAYHVDE